MGHPNSLFSLALTRVDGTVWQFGPQGPSALMLLVLFETDCPTCRLTLPYLDRLAGALGDHSDSVVGVSQDGTKATGKFLEQIELRFPVLVDRQLQASSLFDPPFVPALFLLDSSGRILDSETGFDKERLNAMASAMMRAWGREDIALAQLHDGAPQRKPGCVSRHLQPQTAGQAVEGLDLYPSKGMRATQIRLADHADPHEYCVSEGFSDPLPVVPPTLARVERMLAAAQSAPEAVVGLVPPCYGTATVEKIAANAVMAGCSPNMMRVLIPLIRAACDERFNLHGVQATTHFAAPLIIVNGPVRSQLGFVSGSNVFSNVSSANSTLGRALQLVLRNLGGARPGEIDMSTLGNPGKFSYCIAENEEAGPWPPLHVERGFEADQSTVTLFAAEPPRGVSEHTARGAEQILRTICRTLVTIWSYRMCLRLEALVVVCPEHLATIRRDGFSKEDVRQFLFENSGVPVADFADDGGEGTGYQDIYTQVSIQGQPCYRKFRNPEQIHVLVAGGRAGKFSAVIGSWGAGPRGSQMVTYPIDLGKK